MSHAIVKLDKGNGKSHWVQVVVDPDIDFQGAGWSTAADTNLVEDMQAWCTEHGCGTRMSYDQFRFITEQELSMFLLKWSNRGQ